MTKFFTLMALAILLFACGSDADTSTETSTDTTEVAATETSTITENGVAGISPGDAISDHEGKLIKGSLKNGEGSFTTYTFSIGDKDRAGFFYPDPTDESKVGNIVIKDESVTTANGVHIGSSYAEALAAHTDVEVHGSESEGRVYAMAGKLAYQLKMKHFAYDLGDTKVKPETLVTAIEIRR